MSAAIPMIRPKPASQVMPPRHWAENQFNQMMKEIDSWKNTWRDCSNFYQQRMGKWLEKRPRNDGSRRNGHILDETGMNALADLVALQDSAITSPVWPWFLVTFPDQQLLEDTRNLYHATIVQDVLYRILAQANYYRQKHNFYKERTLFGLATTSMMRDPVDVIRFKTHTAGEFAPIFDDRDRLQGWARETEMPLHDLIERFGRRPAGGKHGVRPELVHKYNEGNTTAMVTVRQLVEKNDDRMEFPHLRGTPGVRGFDFRQMFWETGDPDPQRFLQVEGFRRMPISVGIWEQDGDDYYGRSPAMDGMGTVKELQQVGREARRTLALINRPPVVMQRGSHMDPSKYLPGSVVFGENSITAQGGRELFQLKHDLRGMLEHKQDLRTVLRETFHADLVRAMDVRRHRSPSTAREIEEIAAEKRMVLGPIVDRDHEVTLRHEVETTYEFALDAGWIPDPPPDLVGREFDFSFVSILSQDQKSIGMAKMMNLAEFVGVVRQATGDDAPSDKLDLHQMVDEAANMLGVPPNIINSDRDANATAQARAANLQQQQQMANAAQMAQIAKLAGDASNSRLGEQAIGRSQ